MSGGRLDAKYWLPAIRELQKAIQNGKYKSQKLGDFITDIRYGLSTANDYVDFGIPFLRILNLKNDGIDVGDVVYLSEEQRKEVGKAIVHEGDLLISRSGSVGIVVVVPKEAEGFAFGSFMIKFCLNTKINKQYISAWLNSEASRKLIEREKIGAIQGNITIETIKNFDIPIPPLSVQNEVVKKIQEAYEQKKKKQAEILKILSSIDDFVLGELGIDMPRGGAERVFQIWSDEIEGRIDALFYKPYLRSLLEQIKNKKHFALGQAIADMSGGATPKVTGDYYSDEGGVPFLRVQNITEMGIKLDDVKFIKPEIHETMLKRSQLKKDDLIFTITGRIGSVAVVPDNFEGNINQHSVRFHLQNEVGKTKILPEYVASFFNTKIGRELSFRSTTGGTRPALDYDALKKLVVPLPSVEKQEKIIAGVNTIYKKVKRLRQEAESTVAGAQKEIEQMILG
ncbi:MAG: restriction endonuclease subunit S [Patescibacteria group bacterium]